MNLPVFASRRIPLVAALATVFCAGFASAGEGPGADARPSAGSGQALSITPEQRLREELRVLVLDLVQSGAFGASSPAEIAISIEEPEQRVGNLGVLVDSANAERARDGLRVLATTPGGSAERMGLRTGDVLVAVNGTDLRNLGSDEDGRALAASRLRDEVGTLDDGAEVAFDVRRDSRPLEIKGALVGTWLPAMRLTIGSAVALAAADGPRSASAGCGRISIFDVAPRQQNLHAATLNQIDGRLAGVNGQTTFRVPAGEHVLEVGEAIENRYLAINDRQRNNVRNGYKTLTINVAPDTTYFVAARLNVDRRNEWKDGAFWDPVIWRESRESCR